jgi:hypothetical protein
MPSKPPWLRALLDSTFPPAEAVVDPKVALVARRRAGALALTFAVALALVAVIVGLRGAPEDAGLAPNVAAALVLSRGLFAVGAGAFAFGLLRMAERLLRSS